ncbi:hypothetical protein JMJ77_0002062 [Colletotrichum scovillei]|uniref:Uncharacterized protein n=1 Tax=Colletotrichum scovillei TaxID=1209932 RepID=A0A9P7UCX6_9PEZI|nr:hypothetical protein JMJ77_0002062 [Colletotrichum scovillei]KAG7070476.1 hypothetical protein JMJ76_0001728 [Colletotrichum scovillei]KAG7078693.1 hypothetical protein JMJ78_0002361 [Colletotrichum scovillei]
MLHNLRSITITTTTTMMRPSRIRVGFDESTDWCSLYWVAAFVHRLFIPTAHLGHFIRLQRRLCCTMSWHPPTGRPHPCTTRPCKWLRRFQMAANYLGRLSLAVERARSWVRPLHAGSSMRRHRCHTVRSASHRWVSCIMLLQTTLTL